MPDVDARAARRARSPLSRAQQAVPRNTRSASPKVQLGHSSIAQRPPPGLRYGEWTPNQAGKSNRPSSPPPGPPSRGRSAGSPLHPDPPGTHPLRPGTAPPYIGEALPLNKAHSETHSARAATSPSTFKVARREAPRSVSARAGSAAPAADSRAEPLPRRRRPRSSLEPSAWAVPTAAARPECLPALPGAHQPPASVLVSKFTRQHLGADADSSQVGSAPASPEPPRSCSRKGGSEFSCGEWDTPAGPSIPEDSSINPLLHDLGNARAYSGKSTPSWEREHKDGSHHNGSPESCERNLAAGAWQGDEANSACVEDCWEVLDDVMATFREGGVEALGTDALSCLRQAPGVTPEDVARICRCLRVHTVGFHQAIHQTVRKIPHKLARREATHELWAAFAGLWEAVARAEFPAEAARVQGERRAAATRVGQLQHGLAQTQAQLLQTQHEVGKLVAAAWRHSSERERMQQEGQAVAGKLEVQTKLVEQQEAVAAELRESLHIAQEEKEQQLERAREMQEEAAGLQRQIQAAQVQVFALESGNAALEAKLEEQAAMNDRMTSLEAKVQAAFARETKAHGAAAAAHALAASLKCQLQDKNRSLTIMKAGLESKVDKIDKERVLIQYLQKHLEDTQATLAERCTDIEGLEAKLADLHTQFNKLEMQKRILEELTIPELQESKLELEREVETLRPAQQTINSLKDALEAKRVKKRNWKKKHSASEANVMQLNRTIENLKQKFEETYGDVNELKLSLAQEVSEKEHALEREAALQEQLAAKEQEVEEVRTRAATETSILLQQVADKDQEKAEELAFQRDEYEELLADKQGEVDAAQRFLQAAQKQSENLEARASRLMGVNLQLEEDKRKAEDAGRKTARELHLAVGQLKRMQTRLNEKELTAEQMGESSWISAKTDDLASRYIEEADRMQNQLAKIKNDLRALEGTVAERDDAIGVQASHIAELENNLQEREKKCERMQKEIDSLAQNLEDTESKLSASSRSNEALNREAQKLPLLRKELQSFQQDLALMAGKCERQADTIRDGEEQRAKLQGLLEAEVAKSSTLASELGALQDESKLLLARVKHMGKMEEDLRNRTEERDKAKRLLMEVHERTQRAGKEHAAFVAKTGDELDYLKAFVEEQREKLLKISAAKEATSQQLEAVQRQLENAEGVANASKMMKGVMEVKMQDAVQKMDNAIAEREAERVRAQLSQAECAKLQAQVKELEGNVTALSGRHTNEHLKNALERGKQLDETVTQMKEQLAEMSEEKHQGLEREAKLEGELDKVCARLRELERQVAVTSAQALGGDKSKPVARLLVSLGYTEEVVRDCVEAAQKLAMLAHFCDELQSALLKAFKDYEGLAYTKRQVERDSARSSEIAEHEKSLLVSERDSLAARLEEACAGAAASKATINDLRSQLTTANEVEQEAEKQLEMAMALSNKDKKRALEATDRLEAVEAELAGAAGSRDAALARAEAAEQESKSIIKRQNELEKLLNMAKDARTTAEKARGSLMESMMRSEKGRVEATKLAEKIKKEKADGIAAMAKLKREMEQVQNENIQLSYAKGNAERLRDQATQQVQDVRKDLAAAYKQLEGVEDAKSGVEDKLSQEQILTKQQKEMLEAARRVRSALESALQDLHQKHDQAQDRIQVLSKELTVANTALMVLQKQMLDKKRELREAEMRARMVTEGPQLQDLMARTVRKVCARFLSQGYSFEEAVEMQERVAEFSPGAECVRLQLTTTRVLVLQILTVKIAADAEVDAEFAGARKNFREFTYDFFIGKFRRPPIGEMHLAAFSDALGKFGKRDPLVELFGRLVHVPGMEPPLVDQAGHVMLTLLSQVYQAVDGPADSDFRMGTSRVPVHVAKNIISSNLKHALRTSTGDNEAHFKLLEALDADANGGPSVSVASFLSACIGAWEEGFEEVKSRLAEAFSAADSSDGDGQVLARADRFLEFLQQIDPSVGEWKAKSILRQSMHASLEEGRIVSASGFAEIARNHGIWFLPPRLPLVPLKQVHLHFDDFLLISDSFQSVKPNIEYMINRCAHIWKDGKRMVGDDTVSEMLSCMKSVQQCLDGKHSNDLESAWFSLEALIHTCHTHLKREEFMGPNFEAGSIYDTILDNDLYDLAVSAAPESPRSRSKSPTHRSLSPDRSKGFSSLKGNNAEVGGEVCT